jgi:hypothetical protein
MSSVRPASVDQPGSDRRSVAVVSARPSSPIGCCQNCPSRPRTSSTAAAGPAPKARASAAVSARTSSSRSSRAARPRSGRSVQGDTFSATPPAHRALTSAMHRIEVRGIGVAPRVAGLGGAAADRGRPTLSGGCVGTGEFGCLVPGDRGILGQARAISRSSGRSFPTVYRTRRSSHVPGQDLVDDEILRPRNPQIQVPVLVVSVRRLPAWWSLSRSLPSRAARVSARRTAFASDTSIKWLVSVAEQYPDTSDRGQFRFLWKIALSPRGQFTLFLRSWLWEARLRWVCPGRPTGLRRAVPRTEPTR